MRTFFLLLCLLAQPFYSFAAQEEGGSVEQAINEAIEPAANLISNIIFWSFQITEDVELPFIVLWLVLGAGFFTVYFGFINIRGIRHSIDIVRGKYSSEDDPGEVTHFQALATALSATVGLGNIAGVAVAISMGGPGAMFWMVIAGLLGMSSKFTECILAVKYRYVHADGTTAGGPMYYLSKAVPRKGGLFRFLGPFFAAFFSIMCIGGSLGGGNMFQINQATMQLANVTGGEGSFLAQNGYVFGIVMAVLVGIVIIGGVRSIAKVTDKIVPFMTFTYIIAAVVVLVANFKQIPMAFEAIIEGAFQAKAVCGGVLGGLIMGFRRAAFSNEAGVGSAAIAHSAVKTHEHVTEGFVALLEPFIDTVLVCTMTALVIIISGYGEPLTCAQMDQGVDGISLTSAAFTTVIDWFPYVLTLAVILFAFSTMISWSYYGLKSWEFLFGESKLSSVSYKILFCIFVVIGSAMNLGAVIEFSDAMIFAMSFPNIFGCYILASEVKTDLGSFLHRIKNGEIKKYK